MSVEEPYDDRLCGHGSLQSLIETAMDLAEEMAERHYSECYDAPLCGACTEETPITDEWGPWMQKREEFTDLVDETETRVDRMSTGDAMWVQADLAGAYLDAFRDAGADPEDCVVCSRQAISETEECGHERYDETCPMRV